MYIIIVFAEQFLNIDLVSSCLLVWSASHKQMTLVMQDHDTPPSPKSVVRVDMYEIRAMSLYSFSC